MLFDLCFWGQHFVAVPGFKEVAAVLKALALHPVEADSGPVEVNSLPVKVDSATVAVASTLVGVASVLVEVASAILP